MPKTLNIFSHLTFPRFTRMALTPGPHARPISSAGSLVPPLKVTPPHTLPAPTWTLSQWTATPSPAALMDVPRLSSFSLLSSKLVNPRLIACVSTASPIPPTLYLPCHHSSARISHLSSYWNLLYLLLKNLLMTSMGPRIKSKHEPPSLSLHLHPLSLYSGITTVTTLAIFGLFGNRISTAGPLHTLSGSPPLGQVASCFPKPPGAFL